MNLDPATLAKPSPNPLDPRNEELFEMLVGFVQSIGGAESLMISDEMIMMDMEYVAARWGGFEGDFLVQMPSRSRRMAFLKKAKREVLRRYFQEHVDFVTERALEIEEERASEEESDEFEEDGVRPSPLDHDTIEWELANYLPEFVGRPAAFPKSHAWLLSERALFFGKVLSPYDIRYWTKQLLAAAGLTGQSVVYFISLNDPTVVKIGWTGNLPRRLMSFRNSSPTEPSVHLTMKGGSILERELHRRFRAHRIAREWFRLSPEIAEFIRNSKGEDQR